MNFVLKVGTLTAHFLNSPLNILQLLQALRGAKVLWLSQEKWKLFLAFRRAAVGR